MRFIEVSNVNHALSEGFWHLKTSGRVEHSRNGPVIVAPDPVVTQYNDPENRVLFNPVRDANPVFHLMESIWMLAGQREVDFPAQFSENFRNYAEDDGVVHGAYGARWRGGIITYKDQVAYVINMLKRNREERRAVIQMWDAALDLDEKKRDVPCNTTIYFDCRNDYLNMTVCNRSNDILWGAYGANAVHMSVLQEVVAAGVGISMGVYRQFSNNFHAYTERPQVQQFLDNGCGVYDYYDSGVAQALPLVGPGELYENFIGDCELLVHGGSDETAFSTNFFRRVAYPLHEMYLGRKEGERYSAQEITQSLPGNDWLVAFAEWCQRRDAK